MRYGPAHFLHLTASELVARLEAATRERDHAVLSASACFKVGWDAATSVVERERDSWEIVRRERATRGQHITGDVALVVTDALDRLLGSLRRASPPGLTHHYDSSGQVVDAVRKRLESEAG